MPLYRLRTLLILLAVGPPLLAAYWLGALDDLIGTATGTLYYGTIRVLTLLALVYAVALGWHALAWAIYVGRYAWWRHQNRDSAINDEN